MPTHFQMSLHVLQTLKVRNYSLNNVQLPCTQLSLGDLETISTHLAVLDKEAR